MAATAHSSPSPFGARLQALRREFRLTQIDLSQTSQLSKSYISFLESGVRHPSRDVVLRLAEALVPGESRLRDELLVLAGFTPQNQPAPKSTVQLSYSREDFRSFLQHTLQLIRQQDFGLAEKEIEAGFQRFKRPAQLQTLLAHLELARGGFEQAILFQRTALQHYDLSPDEQEQGLTLVDFILNLGVMYFLWGDQARFGAQSDSVQARKQALQRYGQALDSFEAGLREAPDHLYLLDEAGRVHFNLADLLKGAQADKHWEASVLCLRQVLAHPDKLKLGQQTLRETAAFLALAYARRKDLASAELLLDALSLDQGSPWTVPYIQACCALLAYRAKPQDSLLDRAQAALEHALAIDADAVRAQIEIDKDKDLALLSKHRPQVIEKVMLVQS